MSYLIYVLLAIVIAYLFIRCQLNPKRILPISKDSVYVRNGNEFSISTASSVLSFATLLVAIFDLYPYMGFWLFWAVFTSAFGLLIIIPFLKQVKIDVDVLESYPNLPEYLAFKFKSKAINYVVSFFSIISYSLMFGLEIYVFSTVMNMLLPAVSMLNWVILSIIAVAMIVGFGGFRFVIITDKIQMFVIFLFLIVVSAYIASKTPLSSVEANLSISSLFPAGGEIIGFLISLFLINSLAYLTDFNIFQKIVASNNRDLNLKAISQSAGLLVVSWSLIILIAFLSHSAGVGKSDLEGFALFISQIKTNPLIILIAVAGFMSAAISTASSQFVANLHLAYSVMPSRFTDTKRSKSIGKAVLALAVFTLIPVAALMHMGFSVFDFVLAIYGTQLSIVPAFSHALLHKNARLNAKAATISITTGYLVGWVFAVTTKMNDMTALTYWTPAVSLGISALCYFAANMSLKNES